jgi:group I intron endonuclease
MAKLSGIYAIIHRDSGKRYIGSAANIEKRFRDHKWMVGRGAHHSRHFQSAVNKYGLESFDFVVLEYVSNKDLLIQTEQRYLDEFRSADPTYGFNMSPAAGSTLGIRCSEERRKKIGDANRGKKRCPEFIERVREIQVGRKATEETRARLSSYQRSRIRTQEEIDRVRLIGLANRGKTVTEEQKRNLSAALKASKANKDLAARRRKFSDDQVRILAEANKAGANVAELARQHKTSFTTVKKWINHYWSTQNATK